MKMSLIRYLDRYVGAFILFVLFLVLKPFSFSPKKSDEIKKILCLKFWGIGNIFMILPSIKELRFKYPKAKIVFISLHQNKQILEILPFIDYFLLLNIDSFFSFLKDSARVLYILKKENFDVSLDFEQFARISVIITALAGIKRRIGFNTKGQYRSLMLTEKVTYLNDKHMADIFYDIITPLGISALQDVSLIRIEPHDSSKKRVNQLLTDAGYKEGGLLIGMHPGSSANFKVRRWPPSFFAHVGRYLADKKDAFIFLSGTADESDLCEYIEKAMGRKEVINVSGKISVQELMVLASYSTLFFSNDTATVHLAASMGSRVVGFYGPNTPFLYGPKGEGHFVFYLGMPCSPCITNFNDKNSKCISPLCITSITPDQVVEELEENFFNE